MLYTQLVMSSSPNQNQLLEPEEESLLGIIPLSKRVAQTKYQRISEDLPTVDEAKLLIKKLNLPKS